MIDGIGISHFEDQWPMDDGFVMVCEGILCVMMILVGQGMELKEVDGKLDEMKSQKSGVAGICVYLVVAPSGC